MAHHPVDLLVKISCIPYDIQEPMKDRESRMTVDQPDQLQVRERKLTHLLETMHCDTGKLWADIEDVVIKALVSAHSVLHYSYHTRFSHHAASQHRHRGLLRDPGLRRAHRPPPQALAVRGETTHSLAHVFVQCDVLVYLCVEINHSTSFTTDSRLDREVKDRLLYDTLVLINLGACDRRKATEEERRRIRDWLQHICSKETREQLQEPLRAKARGGVRDWACWGSLQERRVKSTKYPFAPSI
uniref:Uncharacterized protein n=1 Tax=Hucho hucho TaxID=62062 RepID=A0A4W5KQA2_9TELE